MDFIGISLFYFGHANTICFDMHPVNIT